MSSYNPLQLYLSLVSTREEMIFLVRIMSHQMHSENRNKVGTLREIQEEILRGEHRREALESSLLEHLTEGHRKLFFPKILQKTQKINMFFLNKTQVCDEYALIDLLPKVGVTAMLGIDQCSEFAP